jgi:hypothetical protein
MASCLTSSCTELARLAMAERAGAAVGASPVGSLTEAARGAGALVT